MRYTEQELEKIRRSARTMQAGLKVEAEGLRGRPLVAGECFCGCGERTPLATRTRVNVGHVKGEPINFIYGHQGRKKRTSVPRHFLTPEQADERIDAIHARIAELRAHAEADLGRELPTGECLCGCGGRTEIARQTILQYLHVKGETKPFLKGHGSRGQRFRSSRYRVEDRGYKTPCWIWQMSLTLDGYAKWYDGERVRPGHCIFYEREHGPIPVGYTIDHLCGVLECVNPEHLEAVTNAENIRRRSKLNWQIVAEVRSYASEKPLQPHIIRLAKQFDVRPRTIRDILLNKTWREEERPHAPPL